MRHHLRPSIREALATVGLSSRPCDNVGENRRGERRWRDNANHGASITQNTLRAKIPLPQAHDTSMQKHMLASHCLCVKYIVLACAYSQGILYRPAVVICNYMPPRARVSSNKCTLYISVYNAFLTFLVCPFDRRDACSSHQVSCNLLFCTRTLMLRGTGREPLATSISP